MENETIANILRVGLLMGYFNVTDAVRWAERKISDSDSNEIFIDLMFSGNQTFNIVIQKLKEYVSVSPEKNMSDVKRYFLSFYSKLLNNKNCDWQKVELHVLKIYSLNEFEIDSLLV